MMILRDNDKKKLVVLQDFSLALLRRKLTDTESVCLFAEQLESETVSVSKKAHFHFPIVAGSLAESTHSSESAIRTPLFLGAFSTVFL